MGTVLYNVRTPRYTSLILTWVSLSVLYSLTVVRDELIRDKVCVFVIGAYGPAMPHIEVVDYNNNAACNWATNPGVGENFVVG
jgi:hypothetical protein